MRVDVQNVSIPVGDHAIEGMLAMPTSVTGLVLFAHGAAGSRFRSRQRYMASRFHERRLATLLFDLLTVDEQQIDAHGTPLWSNTELLAARLVAATDGLTAAGRSRGLPLGYFGSGPAAAAALVAAALRPAQISAVVSHAGRPELARRALAAVQAPTLFVVAGAEPGALELHREAVAGMAALHRIDVIPGAGPSFDEPGAIDRVAWLAGSWFVEQFATMRHPHARAS